MAEQNQGGLWTAIEQTLGDITREVREKAMTYDRHTEEREKLDEVWVALEAIRTQMLVAKIEKSAEEIRVKAEALGKIVTWLNEEAIADLQQVAQRIQRAAEIAGTLAELASKAAAA